MAKRSKKPLEAPGGRYFALPHAVLDSPVYTECSAAARALLLELCRQHNGSNNGKLHLARSWLELRGWNRPATVRRLKEELIQRRLIVQTRHGGLNNGPHWFAVSWLAISDFRGMDIVQKDYHPGAYLLASFNAPEKKQKGWTPHVLEKQSARTARILGPEAARTPQAREDVVFTQSARTPDVHNECLPFPQGDLPAAVAASARQSAEIAS